MSLTEHSKATQFIKHPCSCASAEKYFLPINALGHWVHHKEHI